MDLHALGTTTLRLLQGDLTEQHVDAIVNAANASLMGGGGVDGAIHRRGGPAILDACRRIRDERHPDGLPTGDAVITTGGYLPARWVIHTVGPVWYGGGHGEAELLASAYHSSLALAREHGIQSLAFPAISTGAYGYPKEKAAPIALRTALAYIRQYPETFREIRFVLFAGDDLALYQQVLERVREKASA